jgi:hypothetical protein
VVEMLSDLVKAYTIVGSTAQAKVKIRASVMP